MEIINKIQNKNKNNYNEKPVTIAFLGDSVTHGCFECYFDNQNNIQTIFEPKNGYPTRVKEMLNLLYPSAQINIINSGISGDNAQGGNNRFERDIAPHSPDLVVVSYGLNDSTKGVDSVDVYLKNLEEIFNKIKRIGSEIIFLMPNMMCDTISPFLKTEREKNFALGILNVEKNGIVSLYFEKAEELCTKNNIKYVNLYKTWKMLNSSGVDTTNLLANYINHPIRELHYYVAIKIIEKMFE